MARDLSFRRAMEFAADLIRIPSLSGGEEAVALRILDELHAVGFDEAAIDRAGNVVGRIAGTGHAPAVALSSHMDVVDVGDPGAWEHDPYAGVLAGGFLHGRGAMDVKGPLAIQVYAAARFVAERPAGDLVTLFSVYEEKGGWGMMHMMDTLGVRPGAVILSEATGGDLCTGHRGHAELAVEIHGVAAHASAPERGRNPNDLLPHVLLALGELSAAQPRHPVLGAATLTPTVVECWPKSGNVIPDRVRVTLDMRVLPGWSECAAVAELRALLAARVPAGEGVRVEVLPGRATHRAWTGWEDEHSNFTPGFLVPDEHPVVQAAAGAVLAATGRAPRIRQWKFGTDGGHSCGTHGVPTLGYAPGDEALAHTNRERLELAQARTVFGAYPALIRAVQSTLAAARGIPVQGLAVARGSPLSAAAGG
ncbi:M20/M25/M40 family metallo-hydrolase [Longimicrobium sp.]|uniref:M20/M25/M40 family metallo-hydrolase n=1 Tax=Longimicrobium sp. TaxID=2029185 RepID=UPI002C90B933|nr:M20/M25/M40 family metallo-hydrolase [Longimicrobium sp.]HSU12932.1 M20/M25/M40 family metallo-hydrolase [Longimicrobium sp.]